jgi:uncharacterized OB-fold protein
MDEGEEVLTSDHILEYPYSRSLGPVIGAFLTGLRDGKLLGVTGSGGRVIVPPTEYDPDTGEDVGELVEVGPEGTVESWSWVPTPRPKHPSTVPFAWVLVKLDGADTSLLHIMEASSPDALHKGMRVRVDYLEESERVGHVRDIRRFVPAEVQA